MQRKRIVATMGMALVLLAAAAAYYWYHHSSTPQSAPQHTAAQQATSQEAPKEPAFDKQQFSTTEPSSPWVIVNKQHPISPTSYAPSDLATVGNGQQMRAEAAAALHSMFTDAAAAGFTLVADSGYRSYNTQVSTYSSIVKSYGQTYADTVSAHPGYSEHQTGWAVDIGTGKCHVADCFADTAGGKWAQANAYQYGFILRYPPTLTAITGYSNEAWHFRYVGPLLAEELHAKNIQTLEQFFSIAGGTTYE